MPLARSDRKKSQHLRQSSGDVPAAAKYRGHVNQPFYMTPAGAHTNVGIRSPPPVPYQHHHVAAGSLIQLPSQVSSGRYSAPGSGSVARPLPPVPESKTPKLSKWTSYSRLSQSVTNLVSQTTDKATATILEVEELVLQSVNGGKNVQQCTVRLLDQIVTSIDMERFGGRENDLRACIFLCIYLIFDFH